MLPPAVDVQRLITASSLGALVTARTRLAQVELEALRARTEALRADRDAAASDLVVFADLVARRGAVRDRLLRDALRAASRGALPEGATGDERDAMSDELAFGAELAARRARLDADDAALAAALESVAAKQQLLVRLDAQARALVTRGGAGDVAALGAIAEDANAAANAIAELTRGATGTTRTAAWVAPVAGVVTQAFGPTALALEPAVTFHGVPFTHFHDAIDIAAPLGTAVVASAAGRVTFVGHLPDGAMVVVIAHDDGLVSLCAHLDDAFSPPTVRSGDHVAQGQVIGYVGLTGMTTGPHLHFSVHDANGPVDPAAVLPAP